MSFHKRRLDNMPITLYPLDEGDCSTLVMSGQAGRLLSYQETKLVAERLIIQLENVDSDEYDKRVQNHNRRLMMDDLFMGAYGHDSNKNYPMYYLNVSNSTFAHRKRP